MEANQYKICFRKTSSSLLATARSLDCDASCILDTVVQNILSYWCFFVFCSVSIIKSWLFRMMHFSDLNYFIVSSIPQSSLSKSCQFGFLFDIDGVIVRGKKLLPSAKQAFDLLTDGHGKFRVPVVFVTNAGNALRSKKAQQLSEMLQVKVSC